MLDCSFRQNADNRSDSDNFLQTYLCVPLTASQNFAMVVVPTGVRTLSSGLVAAISTVPEVGVGASR